TTPSRTPSDTTMTDETPTPEAPLPDTTQPTPEGETSVEVSFDSALQALQAERDQILETLLRTQAEFENIRKRQQREAEQAAKYHALPIIRDLLPGLDNLRRSLEAAQKGGKLEELTKGVEMTVRQFEDFLARHHAKPIPAAGSPFDPHLHEAISQAVS